MWWVYKAEESKVFDFSLVVSLSDAVGTTPIPLISSFSLISDFSATMDL